MWGRLWGRMKKRLSMQYLNSKLTAGRYYDDSGTGLHIYVRKSGSKSWSQKIRYKGKQIELGLGGYPSISLFEARQIAANNKAAASKGTNQKLIKKSQPAIPTFQEVANGVLELKKTELSNEKHIAQWRSTLEQYVFPVIGNLQVDCIKVEDIHQVLKPIWLKD